MAMTAFWRHRRLHAVTTMVLALLIAGVAGPLLAGRSLRTSAREHRLHAIGRTDVVLRTQATFSMRLPAGMVVAAPDVVRVAEGVLVVDASARKTDSNDERIAVRVVGVADSFWPFHDLPAVSLAEGAALTRDTLDRLRATLGDTLELVVWPPSEIPADTMMARRVLPGPITVAVSTLIEPSHTAGLDLNASAAPVPVIVVPMTWLQKALGLGTRINTVLVSLADADAVSMPALGRGVERAWLAAAALPDHGLRIRRVPGDNVMALEGLGGVVPPPVATRVMSALARLQRPGIPALAAVANTLRVGDRRVPYSTVAAIDLDGYLRLSVPSGPPGPGVDLSGESDPLVRGALEVRVGRGGTRVGRVQMLEATASPAAPDTRTSSRTPTTDDPPEHGAIWLNEWTAARLDAAAGDTVHLDFDAWSADAGLTPRHASFRLEGVMPMMRIGGDRTLVPDWPGIANAPTLASWRTPMPLDRTRIRAEDEAYWAQWRTAPKAFVPLEVGQQLWGDSYGQISSIRFAVRDADAVAAAVRAEMPTRVTMDPLRATLTTALDASSLLPMRDAPVLPYDTLLLMAHLVPLAALWLAVWLRPRQVEHQRRDEVLLFRMIGFPLADVRTRLSRDIYACLAIALPAGLAIGAGYATVLLAAMRLWWPAHSGGITTTLRIDATSLLAAALTATIVATLAVWFGGRRRDGWPRRAFVLFALIAGVVIGVTLAPRPSVDTAAEEVTVFVDTALPVMADLHMAAGRAALGLDPADEAWRDVHVQRVRVHDGVRRVLGVHVRVGAGPGDARARLGDELPGAIIPGIAHRPSPSFTGGRDTGDIVLTPAADVPDAVRVIDRTDLDLGPPALVIDEARFKRIFASETGYRLLILRVRGDQAARMADDLRRVLERYAPHFTTSVDAAAERQRQADDLFRVWRLLSLAGVAIGAALLFLTRQTPPS
ncbi:MAG: hypothetical protein IT178_07225 [Acidobacteria bacterium]|nr:hypothetical protein [Acidobacteriota bacterium]